MPAEVSIPPPLPLIGTGPDARLRPLRRRPGRNRTKADLVICEHGDRLVAVKDYRGRPAAIRHTLGRLLIRREAAAYRTLEGVAGIATFLGRLGAFSLATEWIEGRTLGDCRDGSVEAERLDALERIVREVHARGVALADLNHRDVLLLEDGSVRVIDLAQTFRLGPRPGRLRRRVFELLRAGDLFTLARWRVRFCGEAFARAIRDVDPAAVAWHRRARRLKWRFDRLRGAERLPPIDDHWKW